MLRKSFLAFTIFLTDLILSGVQLDTLEKVRLEKGTKMKQQTIFTLTGIVILFGTLLGCGPSQGDFNSLKEDNKDLQEKIANIKQELDDCENGAEKLHAKMERAFEKEDFATCKTIFSEMENRHPDSELFGEVMSIHSQVLSIENQRAEEIKQEAEKERKEKLQALNKLRKNHDDVSGVTWFKNPYFTHYNNRTLTSIYLGQEGSSEWLRIRMSYSGDDWIFFEKAFLSYDGNTKEVHFDRYDNKEKDHDAGKVWEWIDVAVPTDLEIFLREFAQSKNAKMRLTGKYTKTRTLTRNERRGIFDVLKGYDALRQGIN